MLPGRMLWLDEHFTRASALGIARHHRNSGTNVQRWGAVTSREVVRCLGGSVDHRGEHKQRGTGANLGHRLAEGRLQKAVVAAAGQRKVQQLLVLRHKPGGDLDGSKGGRSTWR